MSRGLVGLLLAGMGWALVGCREKVVDPNRAKTVPASVTITYKGQPVEGATLTLQPTGDQQRSAVAITGADGKAVLWTYEAGDGVIPGPYKVTVLKVVAPDLSNMTPEEYEKFSQTSGQAQAPQNQLPARYADAATTDLTMTVAEGGQNNVTFDLSD